MTRQETHTQERPESQETEKERRGPQEESTEGRTETECGNATDLSGSPPRFPREPGDEKKTQDERQETESGTQDGKITVGEAPNPMWAKIAQENTERMAVQHNRVEGVFIKFFASNCLQYKNLQHGQSAEVDFLTNFVLQLEDERNDAGAIASTMCGQFKRMHETKGYWKGVPLSPESMVKPATLRQVMQHTSDILATRNEEKARWESVTASTMSAAEKLETADKYFAKRNADCKRFGIDPALPNAGVLLAVRLAQERERSGA